MLKKRFDVEEALVYLSKGKVNHIRQKNKEQHKRE